MHGRRTSEKPATGPCTSPCTARAFLRTYLLSRGPLPLIHYLTYTYCRIAYKLSCPMLSDVSCLTQLHKTCSISFSVYVSYTPDMHWPPKQPAQKTDSRINQTLLRPACKQCSINSHVLYIYATGPIWSEQTGALSGDWEHFGAVMV